jgi:hypothetical protein
MGDAEKLILEARFALRFVLACAIGTGVAVAYAEIMPDATDASAWNRSGLHLYTDAQTGCQYVGTRHGGMYPRLDGHRLPICEPPPSHNEKD